MVRRGKFLLSYEHVNAEHNSNVFTVITLYSKMGGKLVSTAVSVSCRTFLWYLTWLFKSLNTCMQDNSTWCQLPLQSFKPINIHCSCQSIFWHSSTTIWRSPLNNRVLSSSSHLTTWIDSTPYKKLTSNCKRCWSSRRSEAKTLMVKIKLDYMLLDTKLNTKCLTNLVMAFYSDAHLLDFWDPQPHPWRF